MERPHLHGQVLGSDLNISFDQLGNFRKCGPNFKRSISEMRAKSFLMFSETDKVREDNTCLLGSTHAAKYLRLFSVRLHMCQVAATGRWERAIDFKTKLSRSNVPWGTRRRPIWAMDSVLKIDGPCTSFELSIVLVRNLSEPGSPNRDSLIGGRHATLQADRCLRSAS